MTNHGGGTGSETNKNRRLLSKTNRKPDHQPPECDTFTRGIYEAVIRKKCLTPNQTIGNLMDERGGVAGCRENVDCKR